MPPRWKRAVVKLSGEALMGNQTHGLDQGTLDRIAADLAAAAKSGVEIAVVVGGGNFFRGIQGADKGIDRARADSIGMLATVMNGLALEHAIEKAGQPARALSAVPMPYVCQPYSRQAALNHLGKGRVAVLAGGTGNPFFTTDTGAALRGAELSCDVILKATQVDALTTALLSLTDRAHDLPSGLTVPAKPVSNYQPAGKAGQLMTDLNCFSCHVINGRGSDLAPELTWEGSSVQRAWLQAFLKNPGTLRPALIRRMPRFNLSDSDINELTDYILAVYQTPAFDRDSMPTSGYPAAQVEQGKQLFYSKYGCQSCHIVDTKVDKGYVGPTLTQVGSRLTAPWIYHWLKDPQSLRPGTIEPNRNMSDEDAHALTAFLMTQKGSGRQEAKKK